MDETLSHVWSTEGAIIDKISVLKAFGDILSTGDRCAVNSDWSWQNFVNSF